MKFPKELDRLQEHWVEMRIYGCLGKHRNVAELAHVTHVDVGEDPNDVTSYSLMLWLKLATLSSLDKYYEGGGEATMAERLQWCEDLARMLHFAHEKNVRHANLSARKLLLDDERGIRLCGFSGSSIDGSPATVTARAGYRHPDPDESDGPTLCGELHALGSTLYEIVSTKLPHHAVSDQDKVAKLLEAGEYPSTDMPLGDIIRGCWDARFCSAAQVADEIAKCWAAIP